MTNEYPHSFNDFFIERVRVHNALCSLVDGGDAKMSNFLQMSFDKFLNIYIVKESCATCNTL